MRIFAHSQPFLCTLALTVALFGGPARGQGTTLETLTWPNKADLILSPYSINATDSSGLPVRLRGDLGPAVAAKDTITAGASDTVVQSVEQARGSANVSARRVRRANVPGAVLSLVGGSLLGGNPEGVQVVGNYAFVSDGAAGLQVIDVGNPASPMRVGEYNTSGTAKDVQVVGNYAYVADGPAGLQVIDVSNPAQPLRVGEYDTSGTAEDVQVVGNYAYVADGSAGLQVIDVSNPAQPLRVGGIGGFDTIVSAASVGVEGHYAYVADAGIFTGSQFLNSGLRVIDVSNPANPVQVGAYYDASSWPTGVQVVGNYVYLSYASFYDTTRNRGFLGGGLQVIDVSNPATPLKVGDWVSSYGAVGSVQVVGNNAFVSDEGYDTFPPPVYVDGGVQVLDISNPEIPVDVGRYDLSGGAHGMQVVGDYAYVTTPAGMQILRLRLEYNHFSQEILWQGTPDVILTLNVAYPLSATASSSLPVTLQVISGPAVLANGMIIVTGPGVVVVSAEQAGDLNYLPTLTTRRFNGQQPQTITWHGTTDPILALNTAYPLSATASSGLPVTLRIEGGPAAIAEGMITVTEMGAVVVSAEQAGDAANLPAQAFRDFNGTKQIQFTQVGLMETHGLANSVQVVGNYAYVADGGGGPPNQPIEYQGAGVQVFDVSNPAHPFQAGGVGVFEFGKPAQDVQVVGNYAYVAGPAGFWVLNVGNPVNPAPLSSVQPGGPAIRVRVVGQYAYVAAGSAGLQVFNVSRPGSPTRIGGFATSGSAVDLQVLGNLAYLADGGAGLQVVDISNPASPVRVGGYDTPGSADRVQVRGNYAYVADQNAGLQVIDVSDPANPVRVGGYANADEHGAIFDVEVVGNYAYLAGGETGLKAVDVSNPASPVRVGGYRTVGYAQHVYVAGNYAYQSLRKYVRY